MGKRRSFRPSGCETLEERLAPSHFGAIVGAVHEGLRAGSDTGSGLGPVGALGDSYTDEYQFYGPDRKRARNWVEALDTLRGVNFGPYSLQSRGEPRNQGFAYNWAHTNATSDDAVVDQLPGLAAQVARGQVRYASVFVGLNDFLHLHSGAPSQQILPDQFPAVLQATTSNLIRNYETIVATLLAANPSVRVAVWTLPDTSIMPTDRQQAAGNPGVSALLQEINQATGAFNAVVRSLDANPRLAVVDLAAVTGRIAGSPSGTIPVGGQTISLINSGDDYHHFFLADNIHPGTVGQEIIADTFVSAIDAKFGEKLAPITEPEMIRYAQSVQRDSTHPGLPQPV